MGASMRRWGGASALARQLDVGEMHVGKLWRRRGKRLLPVDGADVARSARMRQCIAPLALHRRGGRRVGRPEELEDVRPFNQLPEAWVPVLPRAQRIHLAIHWPT